MLRVGRVCFEVDILLRDCLHVINLLTTVCRAIMSQSSILNYVNIEKNIQEHSEAVAATSPTETSAVAPGLAEKRQLSHSSTSTCSPASKRSFTFEGEEHEVTFDADQPYWVPMIFRVLDTVNKNVADLKVELAKAAHVQSEEKKESDAKISYLEKQSQWQGAIIRHLMKRDDIQEQYSSRECLLLHGVKENEKEDTDRTFVEAVNKEVGVNISMNDIDRTHRLGPKVPGSRRPRPIIAKLVRHNVKAKIYANKKKLKGKPLMLTERLTKRRATMFRFAREEYGKFNVWTRDGEIFAKKEGQIENITEFLYSIEESIIEKMSASENVN